MIRTSCAISAVLSVVCVAAPTFGDDPVNPPNTLPIERFPTALQWTQNEPRPTAPSLVIDSAKPVAGTDPAELEVRALLVNPTGTPIKYLGYTVDSWSERPPAGVIHPFYREEFLDDSGMWQPRLVGRCGTGKGRIPVPPGHAGEFEARVPANSKTRIGLNVTLTSSPEPTILELWSPAVGTGGEEVPAKAP